jgi:hypothetical protein
VQYQPAGTRNPGRPLQRLLDFATGTGQVLEIIIIIIIIIITTTVTMTAAAATVTMATMETRLRAGWPGNFFPFQLGTRDFSYLASVQTGFGTYQNCNPVGNGSDSHGR